MRSFRLHDTLVTRRLKLTDMKIIKCAEADRMCIVVQLFTDVLRNTFLEDRFSAKLTRVDEKSQQFHGLYSSSKVVPYLIASVGLRTDPGFLAVSSQVT